ncbi:IclR family transcriptional regulator domain-containing protein [Halobellus sp. GM3]|uniref:IclR family transcriptional regulator domain-containing protein n=1 Tax=Halobellus sp. GM3 TaxID=3458410 RepID=UPI00403D5ACC
MTDTGEASRRVTTVDTALDILEYIREVDGASVAEVSEEIGLARSTVHDHLTTLRERDLVVNEGGTYHVGLKFLDIGQYAKSRYELGEISQPILDQLAENTSELVWFGVEDHGQVVKVSEAIGDLAVSIDDWIGERRPMHAYSVGKAILAHLPEARVHEIVDRHGLPKFTDNTITDRDALFEALEQIRETGVAFNDQEYVEGVRAIGVPITHEGTVLGGLSLSGPANRLSGAYFEEELPELLKTARNEIELKWSVHVD